MSAIGTLHHFTTPQHFDRFRIKADIHQQAGMAGSVANDPSLPSAVKFAVMHNAALLR
jgi:hypothetical protein